MTAAVSILLQAVGLAAAAAAGYSFARMREARRHADTYQRAADLLANVARAVEEREKAAKWN